MVQHYLVLKFIIKNGSTPSSFKIYILRLKPLINIDLMMSSGFVIVSVITISCVQRHF